ncbi:hypothetical protein [Arthrobacter sp. FW306-04-A]|uniref:hypothetical protein n=1 Tax=Arthrobacter sp. FW306-04-A TaxID=2879619 RepID=UPI0037C1210A|nr:hypothetical protein LFT43_17965 [Arthrobacter sp. FW306-04-A]
MTFVLQHGYGKADKIESVADHALVSAVILSPTDEDAGALEHTVRRLKERGIDPLLDPQTYLYTAGVDLAGRCHPDNGLNFPPIRWSQSPREVESVVASVGEANSRVGIHDTMIAPSILQSSFEDIWTPLGIQYARAAADAWPSKRVYASAVFEEMAFGGWEQINDWLDEVTTIDLTGFYLLTNQRSASAYPATGWAADRLANAMRMIYTLTEINNYELLWGYSDVEGLLGIAAGATGCATGWHNSLRRFSVDKWRPKSGGAQPIPRRFVGSLLSPLRIEGELSAIPPVGNALLGPASVADAVFTSYMGNPEIWKRGIAQKHHMVSIATLVNELALQPVPTRLGTLQDWIHESLSLFDRLAERNLVFERSYVSKLRVLARAIAIFRDEEGI